MRKVIVGGAAVLALGGALFATWRIRQTPAEPADDAIAATATTLEAPAPPAPRAPETATRAAVPVPRAAAPPAEPEGRLMARLRGIRDKDPVAAIELTREGNRRFPDSADAPERASILIHALAARGEASAARGEAERMVNHYPDSEWVRDVEAFTGAHRHRNLRVTDAGQLESQ